MAIGTGMERAEGAGVRYQREVLSVLDKSDDRQSFVSSVSRTDDARICLLIVPSMVGRMSNLRTMRVRIWWLADFPPRVRTH